MKRIFAVFVSMLLLSLLCACGGDNSSAQETPSEPEEPTVEPVIDIFQIANKNESEVASVLGDPVLSENGNFTLNSGEKISSISNTYAGGEEITFLQDKAARITIYPPDGSLVENGAVLIGLTKEQAKTGSYDNLGDWRWNDNTEFYSIDAFNNGDGTISYIYVITDEIYK